MIKGKPPPSSAGARDGVASHSRRFRLKMGGRVRHRCCSAGIFCQPFQSIPKPPCNAATHAETWEATINLTGDPNQYISTQHLLDGHICIFLGNICARVPHLQHRKHVESCWSLGRTRSTGSVRCRKGPRLCAARLGANGRTREGTSMCRRLSSQSRNLLFSSLGDFSIGLW